MEIRKLQLYAIIFPLRELVGTMDPGYVCCVYCLVSVCAPMQVFIRWVALRNIEIM